MSLSPLSGLAAGVADDRLAAIVERLDDALAGDPDLSFQVAAYHDGTLVLDAVGGPHLDADSVMVPFSVTKNTIGLTVGLLIERGLLDLEAPVAQYWPEFAAKGKRAVTVRQLLSHQAGLPQATPSLSWAELLDDHAGGRASRAEPAVLAAGQRLRLPRGHDRQPRLGARLPRDGSHPARVLRAGDSASARCGLLPRASP